MPTKESFIKNLVAEHGPVTPVYSPLLRSLLVFLSLLTLNLLVISLIGGFSESIIERMLSVPRLFIEVLSGFILVMSLLFYVFKKIIPGEEVTWLQRSTLLVSGFIFLLFFVLSFTSFDGNQEGRRSGCEFEILIYSMVSWPLFYKLFKKGVFFQDKRIFMASATGAALVPGIIMQLACTNAFTHALVFHYLPVLLASGLGLFFFKKLYGSQS